MALKFNPKAAGESAQSKEIYPKGVYRFKVMAAKETVSKSGNDMIQLTLNIHNKDNSGVVKDYLGAWKFGETKILGFLDSVGLPTINGELYVNQIINRQGYLKLDVKESVNPAYPGPQNNVVKYLSHADMVAEGYLRAGSAPLPNPTPPAPVKPEPDPVIAAPSPLMDDELAELIPF